MSQKNPFEDLITPRTIFRPTHTEGELSFLGPCPLCGGNTRATYFMPTPENKTGNVFCFACNFSVNGAKYLAMTKGITLAEAYKYLEISPSSFSFSSVLQEKSPKLQNSAWKEKAEQVMTECRQLLQSSPQYQQYFLDRGFTLESLIRYGFGYHLEKTYPCADWGLSEDKEDLLVHEGLILINGSSLRVRLTHPNPEKYQIVTGSILDSVVPNLAQWDDELPTVLVEGDFDAYILDQEARSVANIVGLGGGALKLNTFVKDKLKIAPYIFIATDNDQSGDFFATKLLKLYPRAIRLPMPKCLNDPNDLVKQGVDVKRWIYSAIPDKTVRYFFLQNHCPDVSNYEEIEQEYQLLYGEPKIGTLEAVQALSAGTPVILSFSDTHTILYEPTRLGKVKLVDPNFSECCHVTFVVENSYRDAERLAQVNILKPESLSLMSAIGTKPALRPNSGDIASLYELYVAYQENNMLEGVEAYYALLKEAQPYLGNLPPFRIDPERWKKGIAKISDSKTVTTWQKEREKNGRDGYFRCNLIPHAGKAGRFSCANPALHGMPKELRAAFVANEGKLLIATDFHCLQPRILAGMANDTAFFHLFDNDYYTAWASNVLGIPEEKITKSQRRLIKPTVISWLYGASPHSMVTNIVDAFKCGNQAGVQGFLLSNILQFQDKFPDLLKWKDHLSEQVRQNGIVYSVSGRPISIPENRPYSAACFVATGTEVEIMLRAIIEVGSCFKTALPSAKIKFWLHDELVVEVIETDVDEAKTLLEHGLTKSFTEMLPNAPDKNLLGTTVSKWLE